MSPSETLEYSIYVAAHVLPAIFTPSAVYMGDVLRIPDMSGASGSKGKLDDWVVRNKLPWHYSARKIVHEDYVVI